jgi:hypothetical protein
LQFVHGVAQLGREIAMEIWAESRQLDIVDQNGSTRLLIGASDQYGRFCIVDSAMGETLSMLTI